MNLSFSDFLTVLWIANTIVLAYIARKTSRIDSLEETVETKTEELINQRFANCQQQHKERHEQHAQIIALMQVRLERGEEHFGKLDEARHQLEVKLLREMSELKDRVVTVDDMKNFGLDMRRGS